MSSCCCRRGLNTFLRPAQGRIPRFDYHQKRLLASQSTSQTWKHRSLELPVGLSGSVKVDVFSPNRTTREEHGRRNLLVHLPPGPSIGRKDTPSIDVLAQLRNSFPPSTSLVSINYRLGNYIDSTSSPKEPTYFPVPVHDVATAFDYLTSPTSAFNAGYSEVPKICLLGSNIGGALATMLALTEPNEIHGLALVEPMADWTGLDDVVEQLQTVETSSTSQKRQKQKLTHRYGEKKESVIAAAKAMIRLRASLFQTPSAYFDPFASPMLFLRAPGKDTPLASTIADQSITGTSLDQLDGYGDYDSVDPATDDSQESRPVIDGDSGFGLMTTTQPRRRKVLRRWPAVGNPESVTLPYVGVFVAPPSVRDVHQPNSEADDLARGHAALMRAQGLELVELMRRACFLGREKSFAEERVQIHEGQDQLQKQQQMKAEMQQSAIDWVARMFLSD
ncbi:hypothetical protein AYO20_08771 [Fonsecaea nubica]|uniref:BD-FAE-like domain-containing protein n=1 Tax=Fonsecaea nubica TaxID=856822 RepID=A0A178CMG0_9EURO|nr:hypothetical protein AYO20_08771 [Fonsecaea nubica]OAL30293.1 hypothetical protein AYO20_08771 [Fonsecaea nubica]